jgi:hypothetical protein
MNKSIGLDVGCEQNLTLQFRSWLASQLIKDDGTHLPVGRLIMLLPDLITRFMVHPRSEPFALCSRCLEQ